MFYHSYVVNSVSLHELQNYLTEWDMPSTIKRIKYNLTYYFQNHMMNSFWVNIVFSYIIRVYFAIIIDIQETKIEIHFACKSNISNDRHFMKLIG